MQDAGGAVRCNGEIQGLKRPGSKASRAPSEVALQCAWRGLYVDADPAGTSTGGSFYEDVEMRMDVRKFRNF